ncbi:protein O-mannosyl-transferase family [Saccharicrinis sp. FJH62]|uniref:protein O-mannosyl-transferase family n=1 Tax=Saccharicrinis sp. FJH62 TaxID=3344657 RepID=UPI0035D49587
MKNYKIWNIGLGWGAFAVAAFTYLSTVEPTASFWDCGEFIASSYKLLVGHPPGAPVFMMIGRIFTLFAPDPSKVAVMMNSMSALASAFTILFLFWTITHLAKKLIVDNGSEITAGQSIAVLGAGLVGSLAYTFSDTFWFSAVEGEVYAMSSLFTAVVFWAILKWENEADKPFANRWIILIGFLIGLSVGVHLLNLLAIPAIILVYYFKKYTPTIKGTLLALVISFFVLMIIMYGIIPGIVKLASVFELIFVNGIGLPYHSGMIFFIILLAAGLAYGIYYTYIKVKVLWNTILTFLAVIIIGYSAFAMVLIRSNANPPMNQNDPNDAFSLLSYLNREQYGDRPLVYGQYYDTPIIDTKQTSAVRDQINGRYEIIDHKLQYVYDPTFEGVFPRMWSNQPSHISAYKSWAKIKGIKMKGRDGKMHVKPTFTENLRFLFRYQLGHMYWRYFMWNFAGRQNEIQGNGGSQEGNWVSGINFIDNPRVGNQEKLPEYMKNDKARNEYYMLPLLLGLFGIAFQLFGSDKNKKNTKGFENFAVVAMLFILTGIAIVIYLNQYPYQPRERDYAYAGSFYAFSIWIGIGVLFIWDMLKKLTGSPAAGAIATIAGLAIPSIMGAENWNDHDRSGRYAARDFAWNYLQSTDKEAVLFTNGDNDTFPLWYVQEVEGTRTDVRVCNLSYLQTGWYIDQMRKRAYDSNPVKFTLDADQTREGQRNLALIDKVHNKDKVIDLKRAIEFVGSNNSETKESRSGYDYFPGTKFSIPVDSAYVVDNGTVRPQDANRIDKEFIVDLSGISRYVGKNSIMVLDILATNQWQRPVYFAVTVPDENYIDMNDHFQVEGLAYRVVPVTNSKDDIQGRVATDIMYDNMMNKFKWGGVDTPGIWMDQTILRMCYNYRNNFTRLAGDLLKEGDKEKAQEVLLKAKEVLPEENVPHNMYSMPYAEMMMKAGLDDDAVYVLNEVFDRSIETLDYYLSMQPKFKRELLRDIQQELGVIRQIYIIADRNNKTDLAKKAEDAFKVYYGQLESMD